MGQGFACFETQALIAGAMEGAIRAVLAADKTPKKPPGKADPRPYPWYTNCKTQIVGIYWNIRQKIEIILRNLGRKTITVPASKNKGPGKSANSTPDP